MPKSKDKKTLKRRYDFRIPKELLECLTDLYGGEKKETARAIHNAIDKIILSGRTYSDTFRRYTPKSVPLNMHPFKLEYPHHNSKHQGDEESEYILYYFREDSAKVKFLQFYYRNYKTYDEYMDCIYTEASASKAIQYAIYDAIYCDNSPMYPRHAQHLVPYTGQKNSNILKIILNACEEITGAKQIATYIEPFMGSANVFFHLKNDYPRKNCYLNDLDYSMVCLMETIRDNLTNFKAEYLKYDRNEETFLDALARYRLSDKEKKKLPPLRCALDIFYLLNFSYHANKQDFTPYTKIKENEKKYKYKKRENFAKPLIPLYALSCLLTNVNISCRDALEFIDEHLSDKNALFYIDSPYFFSEDVYDTCNKNNDYIPEAPFPHEELAQKLIDINNSGNFFIASNRVTVSSTRKNKSELSNLSAIEKANKCYGNCGFYYILIACRNKNSRDKNQVEILVSNYPFENSKPCTEITEAEVNDCIARMLDPFYQN